MRTLLLILGILTAAGAALALVRRRRPTAGPDTVPAWTPPEPAPPAQPPATEATAADAQADAMPTRFGEVAEDEHERRHEAAERLKADFAAGH